MTAPEQDEFEVPEEMLATARSALLGPSNLTNIKTAKPTLTTDQLCERVIRAVALIIRAEGYRQGVEDAARLATELADTYAFDRARTTEQRMCDYACERALKSLTQSIFALLPNHPDASDKRTET